MLRATAILVLALTAPAQDLSNVDDEGFIRNWLVLAPLALENEDSGATEIDKDQLKDEAKLTPKEGEKVKHGGKELAWKKHKTADYFIDFRESFGGERGEDAAGYAVAYVICSDEMKGLKIQMGSNDQAKVYLNGTCVVKFGETRTLDKDQDSAEVALKKGCNAVVFKVINEKNNWQGCLRFTRGGAAVKDVKIALAPQ
jgi:hypothetical protein